eukprot:CAMPEP_0114049842 /NCGR_PEP_ID=MMETSP1339-20121228/60326_1 /TAXON_ID=94617 /ORGANISM="Fibrocapsa japonica" /LENGTH=44 /assembly_acc=CAM_ASM_000762
MSTTRPEMFRFRNPTTVPKAQAQETPMPIVLPADPDLGADLVLR